MALEAVVYPQQQQAQGHFGRDSSYAPPPWSSWPPETTDGDDAGEWDPSLLASLVQNAEGWGEEVASDAASPERELASSAGAPAPPPPVMMQAATRRKRRRTTKMVRNEEEIENQRMTHIAVERNRRRQMNEYLAVLRSLMPASYAQRGDQASIVGGAINYVRELEHILQSLEVQKSSCKADDCDPLPFAIFFSFPQYSTSAASHGTCNRIQAESVAASIEATMVEGHASLKVQVKRRPRQLLRLTVGLQQLGLTTLHLNVSTAGATAMYTFSLKLEDECKLSSVEEIAEAVHEILRRIQEEQSFVDAKTCL